MDAKVGGGVIDFKVSNGIKTNVTISVDNTKL